MAAQEEAAEELRRSQQEADEARRQCAQLRAEYEKLAEQTRETALRKALVKLTNAMVAGAFSAWLEHASGKNARSM